MPPFQRQAMPYKDPSKAREYRREWKRKNRDKLYADQNRRAAERRFALLELAGGLCSECKSTHLLEFHHPGGKDFTLSGQRLNRSWKKILAEAERCILLCKSCHTCKHR